MFLIGFFGAGCKEAVVLPDLSVLLPVFGGCELRALVAASLGVFAIGFGASGFLSPFLSVSLLFVKKFFFVFEFSFFTV